MKRKISFFVAIFVVFFTVNIAGQNYPEPIGYVNDFANVLPAEDAKKLNQELILFEEKTTVEIAVVTVKSLQGYSEKEYAKGLGEKWGVGKRYQYNGLVFLIAPNERKARIQGASGLNPVFTEDIANKIMQTVIIPKFKSGNMPYGIIDGTHAIMRVLDPVGVGTTANNSSQDVPATAGRQQEKNREYSQIAEPVNINWSRILWILCIICFISISLYFLLPRISERIKQKNAKDYVLGNIAIIAMKFDDIEPLSKHEDARSSTQENFTILKNKFLQFEKLNSGDGMIDWIKAKVELDLIIPGLNKFSFQVRDDLAYAEKARKEGPELLKKVPLMLGDTEGRAQSPDVKEETYSELHKLHEQFALVSQLASKEKVDWVEVKDGLDQIVVALESVNSQISNDLTYAEKARKEGPELMKKIPDLIAKLEQKIAKGKESKNAKEKLEQARTQYSEVRNKYAGMSVIDWIIVYSLLNNVESNINQAESSYEYDNTSHESNSNNSKTDDSYHSSYKSSSNDFGFGSSGGFGGGGGFNSGNGASGSW